MGFPVLRRFIDSQRRLSARLEDRLPERYRVDGNQDFIERVVPHFVRPGVTIYDVGGGKKPFLDPERKAQLGVRVVGLDIDEAELDRAPAGAYDSTICADVTRYQGQGDADIVICQALLEHVPDTDAAMSAIAGMLKPGGVALLFVPCRNAMFARLNLVLPEVVKRHLLFGLYPSARGRQGFPAWYDRCTPREMRAIARDHGLHVVALKVYFSSRYFSFLFPLHVAWRSWVMAFERLVGEQAAESFSLVLRKPASETSSKE